MPLSPFLFHGAGVPSLRQAGIGKTGFQEPDEKKATMRRGWRQRNVNIVEYVV